MHKRITLALLLPLVMIAGRARSQDSLSYRDAIEIKYQAKFLVSHGLNSLMNFLSGNINEESEDAQQAQGSYSGDNASANKIFRDGSVQVEYDLNPSIQSSSGSHDESIEAYFKDFDLLYEKSDSNSVDFSNVTCSPVKKTDILYVKVYFNSLLKNRMKGANAPYALTNRVAEIHPVKTPTGWKLTIDRIAFFNPADTLTDTLHNIAIFRDPGTKRVFGNVQDSVRAVAQQQTLDDQLEQEKVRKFETQEAEKASRIRAFLAKGDEADGQNDLVHALAFYRQAKDVDPTGTEPLNWQAKRKVREETDKISVAQTNDQDLYKKLIAQAQVEEEDRQYDLAIRDYNKAIKYQPDEASKYEAHIRDLDGRYAILSQLYEEFKQGEYKTVRDEYLKALKTNKNSDFYLGLGQCYDKLNDPKKAEDAYTNAITQDARNLKAIQCLAELYTRANNYPKAISRYKLYLTVDPEKIDVYLEMSRLHDLMNSEDDAIQDLANALDQNAKSAPVYYARAMLLLKKDDFKGAIADYSTSILIDSTQSLAFYYRGKCQMSLGNIDAAASDFGLARRKGLDNDNLANVHAYADGYFRKSASFYDKGYYDSATANIDHAIAIDPVFAEYHFRRGECYFTLKNYKEAIFSYDNAVRLNASFRDALYKRGLSYDHLGEYRKSIDNYGTILAFNGQDAAAQRGEGDANFALGDFHQAAINYEACLKSASATKLPFSAEDLADIYNKKGLSYFETSDNEKAINDFKTALHNNRNLAEAYFNLGNAYYQTTHFSDATENISKALTLQSKPPCRWPYVLAKAYEGDKDLNKALSAYTTAVSLDAGITLPDAVYLMGRCQYKLGLYPEALPSYNHAAALHEDSLLDFREELGNIYLNTGKFDSAYATFNVLYLKDNANGMASYGIATALVLQGKTDESIPWFDRCFETKMVRYNDARKNKLLEKVVDLPAFKALKKKYN